MGMFDTFEVPGAKCPNCGHVYDAAFQSKDFQCLMDTIAKGEDVWESVPQWWLYKDTLFDKGLTIEKATRIWKKDPKRFRLSIYHIDGKEYPRVDEFLGHRQRNFSGVKDATFEAHDVCPKCKKYYSVVG